MRKLLLIESHSIICAGIEFLLRNHLSGFKLEVISGVDHLNNDISARPGVILLGCNRDGLVELECSQIKKITNRYPNVPLVLYNYNTDYASVLRYFKAGASGYLSIDSEGDLLADCLDTVMKGHKYISVQGLLNTLDLIENTGTTGQQLHRRTFGNLTKREHFIAGYISRGMRTTELARMMHLQPSTISTVKATILRKLNLNNVIELGAAIEKIKERKIQLLTSRTIRPIQSC